MRLVMFDIDGTLVDSDAFDSACFRAAVGEVTGLDLDPDWAHYSHITDAGIVNQFLRKQGLEQDRDELAAAVRQSFIGRIGSHLARFPARPVSGAAAFIAELRARPGVTLVIATGGWRDSALLKLRSAGIDISGLPLASSDDHFARVEIMRIAARAATGSEFLPCIYFGDGEWDRQACARLGYDFVLVGNRTRHSPAIVDFSDPSPAPTALGLPTQPSWT